MDPCQLTEADLPVRSVAAHLRDVAFQVFWEGNFSPITDMYADAAHRAGATWAQIKAVRDYCLQLPEMLDANLEAVLERVASVPLPL